MILWLDGEVSDEKVGRKQIVCSRSSPMAIHQKTPKKFIKLLPLQFIEYILFSQDHGRNTPQLYAAWNLVRCAIYAPDPQPQNLCTHIILNAPRAAER